MPHRLNKTHAARRGNRDPQDIYDVCPKLPYNASTGPRIGMSSQIDESGSIGLHLDMGDQYSGSTPVKWKEKEEMLTSFYEDQEQGGGEEGSAGERKRDREEGCYLAKPKATAPVVGKLGEFTSSGRLV